MIKLPSSPARPLRCALLLFSLSLGLVTARADVPVPPSVMHPRTNAEAWNVIRLALANVDVLLKEQRPGEVANQLSLCNPALRALAELEGAPERQAQIRQQMVLGGVYISAAAQAAGAGDAATTQSSLAELNKALDALRALYPPEVVAAEIYACPMHPDFTSTDAGTPCAKCGMPLTRRRIPYSFLYMKTGEPSTTLTATPAAPLVPGQPVNVKVQLTAAGSGAPVTLDDLMLMHTQKIHLLIVDPSLQDYHHEHPAPTGAPGEWTFTFTPKLASGYRIFADIVPVANGVQEYAIADLLGSGAAQPIPPHPADVLTASAGGYDFVLKFDTLDGHPPAAGQVESMTVFVSEHATGQPFTRLSPVMNTFAHAVGFYEDHATVLHLHPLGGEILDPSAHGGPKIEFKFYAPQPGYIRLYCQVLIGGQMVFAPFDLNIPR